MVKSCRNGINSCSSSNELGARYAQPHRKPSKERKTTPGKHVPAFAVQMSLQKLRKWKRNSFCSSEQSHFGEGAGSEGSQGTTGPAGLRKKVHNRKANCFALLKQITNLKCQFRCQVRPQSPAKELPQVAPWHHVGVTMDITL